MSSMKQLAFYIFLLCTTGMFAQNSDLIADEKELAGLLRDLRSAENDTQRSDANDAFKSKLEKVLRKPESFNYPFNDLKTVGVIDSPDKKIRIVNYNVEQDDMNHQYHCFVLFKTKRDPSHQLVELKDVSGGMPSFPTEIIDADNWYGALYYRIIPVKKGRRTLYTVLGWDHNSSLSQVKLLDVIYISGSTVKLGNPIFRVGKETKKRMFYEHSKKATMHLNYDDQRKRIMMDHLSPESPSMKNFRSFYVPDLSYDAFVFERNRWVLKEDVIGVNKGDDQKKKVVYVKNERTGKVEKRTIKNKWENPQDLEAPAGGSEHVAVTPESEKDQNNADKDELDKRVKKDKRDPSELSIMKGVKKKKRKKN